MPADQLRDAQLVWACGNYKAAVWTPAIPVLATAALFYTLMPLWPVLIWAGIQLAASVGTYALMKHWIPRVFPTERAVRYVALLMSAWGLCWGCAMVVVAGWSYEGADQALGIGLTTAVLGGVNALTLARLAALHRAASFYATSVSLGFLIGLWGFAPVKYAPLGLLAVFYTAVVWRQTRAAAATLADGIALRYQNQQLVQRLETKRQIANEARAAAEKANADKSRYLASASHDLRQPLHAMLLFVDALAKMGLSTKQGEVLSHAQAAAQATTKMLNTLLDFSRIEGGAVKVQAKPFAVQPMLTALEMELGAEASSQNLVYRTHETTLAALADPTLVELILRNLVSNALRYTDHGGLLVSCRRRGQTVLFQVWDTGIGIGPADQARVFEEFEQAPAAQRERRSGLGLGLAIAQRLAHAMGSQVTLVSHPGKGSVFGLAVPLYEGVLVEDSTPVAPTDLPAGLRVLVVEDVAQVRHGMHELLETWGMVCRGCDSLAQAQATVAQLAADALPQLLITDYKAGSGPGAAASGGHALQVLRSAFAQRQAQLGIAATPLPAVMITGDTSPERAVQAQQLQSALLHKPVSGQALRAAMAHAMELAERDSQAQANSEPRR